MISYNSCMAFKTIIEPFKIKSVESLPITTEQERKEFLEREHWNVFGLRSQEVTTVSYTHLTLPTICSV